MKDCPVTIGSMGMSELSIAIAVLQQQTANFVTFTTVYEDTGQELPRFSSPCWPAYENGVRRPPDEIRQHPALARQALNDHKRFVTQGCRGAKKLKGYQGQRWA